MTCAIEAPTAGTNQAESAPGGLTGPRMGQTLRSAAFLSIQPLALNVLSVPVLAYIIRRLGADGYAHWMTAATLVAASAVIANPGLRGAFVRQVAADPGSAKSALADQLGLRLLLTILAGLMVTCICLALGYPAPVLWCTVVGVAGMALTTVATTFADLLQSVHRIQTLAAVNLAAGLSLTGASVIAARWGNGPVAIAAAYLIGPGVSAGAMLIIVQRWVCPVGVRFHVPRCVSLLVRARFFAAQQLLSIGSTQAEALMLPLMIRMSQFGFFTAAAMIPNRASVLPDALCTAAYPGLVKACASGAHRGARLVLAYLTIAALGGALVSLAVMVVAEPIGRLLFPAEPGPFAEILRLIIWCLPLVGMDMVLSYSLNAAGRDSAVARASLPAAAVTLIASVALVSSLGVTGACWSMLLRPLVRIAFLAPVAFRAFGPAVRARSPAAESTAFLSPGVLGQAG
jgi:O-antigen/teichoic acid export membrane protein